jgi:hypothetical protein
VLFRDGRRVDARIEIASGVQQHRFAEMLDRPLVHGVELLPQFLERVRADLTRGGSVLGQVHSRTEPGVVFGVEPPIRRVVDLDIAGEEFRIVRQPGVEAGGNEQGGARRDVNLVHVLARDMNIRSR